MRILLLGANGNLGTAFRQHDLQTKEQTLISWDKEEIDVTDHELLEKKISELRPDIIINAVGYSNVDECERSEEAAAQAKILNEILIGSLADIALEYSCTLVHYSSDYVFAGKTKIGYDEQAEPSPLNIYGETKRAGELALQRLSGRGLKWYLIRTARLFGPRGQGPQAKPNFFEVISDATKVNLEVRAVKDERGSFTYTPDLVAATMSLLESDQGFGMYHFVNEGSASWYEAAAYFLKKINVSANVIPILGSELPRPAKRPLNSTLRNTKRPPLRSWQAAVDEYCKTL